MKRIMTYVGLLYQDLIKLWIRAMVLRHNQNRLVLPKVRGLQELKMTLADRFETWARQHEQRGIEKGEAPHAATVADSAFWPAAA